MLQEMLDVVYRYSRKYRFKFNKDKSNIMIFGKKGDMRKFRLGESELELVENYKYLGLILDENFTWKNHLEKMLEKARKRTRALCAMGRAGGAGRPLFRGWQIWSRPLVEYGDG